jgi:hypothetical protein
MAGPTVVAEQLDAYFRDLEKEASTETTARERTKIAQVSELLKRIRSEKGGAD